MLSTPDSSNRTWRQTDLLVSQLEAQAPGRVATTAAGFARVRIARMSLLSMLCSLGRPGIGLALGIGNRDVANLEREAEDYQ